MIDAFITGFNDGWSQPFELVSGMTYYGVLKQVAWDMGSIIGQFFGKLSWRKP